LNRFWREPLVHFLVVGLLVFAVYEVVRRDQAIDPGVIQVDAEQILFYVQHRYRLPGREAAREWLQGRSSEAVQSIVDEYVLEEALFREAKALNLDRDDYSGRRRLIGQLEYLNRAFIGAGIVLDEPQLRAYYDANKERYTVPAAITFAHVFFSTDQHGEEEAGHLAREQMPILNDGSVGFNDTGSFGDRFLYHRYYADRDFDVIASHFGSDMSDALRTTTADTDRWIGPFKSVYGYHVVMVARRSDQRVPAFEETIDRVRADATSVKTQERINEVNAAIKAGYRVEIAKPIIDEISQ
jgi:peptidyl-prolyl cis-trans isomerase C